MPRPPAPLPASLPDAFRVRDALAAGATAGRMRASDLSAPFRGIRVRVCGADGTAAEAHVALARAYAAAMPETAVFSHRTAALIRGLPVPVPSLIDVASLAPRRAVRAAGVRGRQIDPDTAAIVEVHGLRLCDPATTWVQLGGLVGDTLTIDDLIVVADAIVRVPRLRSGHAGDPRSALATTGDLTRALTAGPRRGTRALRSALADVRVGSASPPETRLRLALVRDGLPEPDIDVEIYGEHGEFIGVSDLAYLRWRVLVEYEGEHHRVDSRQWNRDIEKYALCDALGWTVVRVTAAHVRRGAACGAVRAALRRRGWRPDGH